MQVLYVRSSRPFFAGLDHRLSLFIFVFYRFVCREKSSALRVNFLPEIYVYVDLNDRATHTWTDRQTDRLLGEANQINNHLFSSISIFYLAPMHPGQMFVKRGQIYYLLRHLRWPFGRVLKRDYASLRFFRAFLIDRMPIRIACSTAAASRAVDQINCRLLITHN